MSFCLFAGVVLNGQALKVASNSNVGLGLSDPDRTLHMSSDNAVLRIDRQGASAPGFLLVNQNTAGTVNEKVFFFGAPASAANNGYFFIGDYGQNTSGASTRRFVIDNSGDVIIGTTTSISDGYKLRVEGAAFKTTGGSEWNILSDRRLKKNIKSYGNGLETILKINPVEYDYNGEGGTKNGDHQIGVIAQELQKIAPMMVDQFTYTPDNGSVDIDNISNQESPSRELLSVNPSALKWILVNAVKEQQELIEEKDARIEALEEKMIAIEKMIASVNLNEIDLNSTNQEAILNQNTPNPFRGQTKIAYSLPDQFQAAQINIFNMNGQVIKTVSLNSGGKGELTLNSNDLPSGTYTYNMILDGELVKTNKMIIQN